MIDYILIVGEKNSGKTQLITKLIPHFTQKGYRVATIKHHHQSGGIDLKGKDTNSHFEAGADRVMISSPSAYGVFTRVQEEMALESLLELNRDMDLVLVEGYKNHAGKKIELLGGNSSTTPRTSPEERMAIVTDYPERFREPVFHLDDDEAIADYILQQIFHRAKQNE